MKPTGLAYSLHPNVNSPETASSLTTSHRSFYCLSFCPYYPPHLGGLENYAQSLHQQLAAHGHHVTVFTANLPPVSPSVTQSGLVTELRYPAFDFIYNYPLPKIWLPSFWRLWFQLFTLKADVVFSATRFFSSSILAYIFARLTSTPWLHIEHGSDDVQSNSALINTIARFYDRTLGRFVLRHSAINLSPSLSAQTFIKRFDNRFSPVIYRGIDHQLIQITSKLAARRSDHVRLVYIGRLISGKAVPDLISAVSLIKTSQPFSLDIIGSGVDHDYLQQLINTKDLNRKVKLLGPLPHPDTINYLRRSDIFINPSHNEGLPTVLLEAALCRCSIVATDVGGTTEIISDQHSALIFSPGDTSRLAYLLTTLINNPNLRHQLSAAARTDVLKKFSWSTAISQYLAIISAYAPPDTTKH